MDNDIGPEILVAHGFFKELDLTGPQLCLKKFCKLPYPMEGGTPEKCSKSIFSAWKDQLSKMVDFKNDWLEEDSFIWKILITVQEMQRCNDLLRSESCRLV